MATMDATTNLGQVTQQLAKIASSLENGSEPKTASGNSGKKSPKPKRRGNKPHSISSDDVAINVFANKAKDSDKIVWKFTMDRTATDNGKPVKRYSFDYDQLCRVRELIDQAVEYVAGQSTPAGEDQDTGE